MADLLDLFDEDPAPAPAPPIRPLAEGAANWPDPQPPPVPVWAAKRPPPTVMNHRCEGPDCKMWGSFGWMPQGIETSRWWCRTHAPRSLFPIGP